ncbi:MAG: nucleotide-binding protein [Gammaproteobacteria bacterium]|nr:MAG: RNase adapter RapZ [Pseudomonadota bacterium]MBC6946166.1 RNase adapter RapZ [Gammaproteobacteria bacterium]MCE7895882.1 RNase adapter RapZ [Gammaproteobacteria bacterium PRO8]MDL1881215.1 RNase adapter RapZ [Gammaproteobacteria bacterium PRO2]MCL4778001.1 RNase adapter RapZ [Gammaproteobacteria bacterium]
MRLIIVSGLSGSGKSVALHLLEDVGFYCIDNLPAALLDSVISQIAATGDPFYENLAVGVDVRSRAADLESLPELIRRFRNLGIRCEIVFLHASEDSLLKRYAESRRPHPLSARGMSLREAITRERELLGPVMAAAELIIDTSQTSVYQLRDAVRGRVGLRAEPGLSILIESFGYKHGIPLDADFVFDLRCLPNPYWEISLRPLTGRDPQVIAYLDAQPPVQEMYRDILGFLQRWIPRYADFNRNYLTVALGCTGGQHRSVYMADRLATELAREHQQVLIRHTELRGIDRPPEGAGAAPPG